MVSAWTHSKRDELQKFWKVHLILWWEEQNKECPLRWVAPKNIFLITWVFFLFFTVFLGATQVFKYFSLFLISLSRLSFPQHSPVFCVAKRMTRATMMMKSKETIVMRPISREVQRGFLADLGGLVSVILRSPPSAAGCINSPEEGGRTREEELRWLVDSQESNQQQFWWSINHLSSNMTMCCFSLVYIIVNWIMFGFGLFFCCCFFYYFLTFY